MPLDVSDLLARLPQEAVQHPLGSFQNPGSLAQQLAMAGVAPVGSAANVAPGAVAQSMGLNGVARAGGIGGMFGPARAAASTAPVAENVGLGATGLGAELGGVAAAGSRFAPVLSRSALMRGGMYAGAGLAAGQLAGKYLDNEGTYADEGLSGALTGAGVGAGIGSVIPGIGTVIGGGLGAAAGGLIGLFGPKSTGTVAVAGERAKRQKQLDDIMAQYPISDQNRQQIQLQLALGLQDVNSKEQVAAVYGGIMQQLPGLIMQDQAQTQDAARAAAVYAMLTPALERANGAASRTAGDLSQAMQAAAGTVSDPGLRAVYKARAGELPQQQARANQNQLLQLALADAAYQAQAGNKLATAVDNRYRSQAAAAIAPSQSSTINPALLAQLGG